MSDNVGLSTPRGSGTSGYVQRNRAFIKPRDQVAPYPTDVDKMRHRHREPDKDILEHEAKREIEVKVLELRDELEDAGIDEDEIDDKCDELRKKLLAERKRKGGSGKREFKSHEVHNMADAKMRESERLRNALKISKDYEEGDHWRRQEGRQRSALSRETKPDDQGEK